MKKLFFPALFLSLCFGFTACNNDDEFDGFETTKAVVEKEEVDNSRIISYSNGNNTPQSAPQTRLVEDKAAPTIPADAIDMVATGYQAYQAQENANYYVPADATFDRQIQLKNNTNYYVAGTLKLSTYGSGSTIYVLPGGSIELPSTLNTVTIESWGAIVFRSSLNINTSSSVTNYDEANTLVIDDINCQGALSTTGSVTVKSIQASGLSGKITVDGDLDVENAIKISNYGSLTVEGSLSAVNFELNSNSVANLKSCAFISGQTYVTNMCTLNLYSFLKTGNLKIDSWGTVNLFDNTLVLVDNSIELSNSTSKFNNMGTQYAVISCDELIIHQNEMGRMSGGPIDLHAATITNNTGAELAWTANVIFDGETYFAADGCRPEFGTQPVASEPVYVLSHIAEVRAPHERISATSIDFKNNKAFVSWHEYGEPFQGYIDAVDIASMSFSATLHSDIYDFNHIAVEGENIYVAGGCNASGAFYAPVNYVAETSSIEIELQKLDGASGNCIIKEGDEIWVVSGQQGGISVIPTNRYTTLPEAKYIVKYGERIAVLAGIEDCKVYEYSIENGELVKEYSVGSIAPDYGKNVLVADGENLYVALGQNGIKVFNNGVEVASVSKSAVGIDVDDEYVYAACSDAGLIVYNKADLTEVKRYSTLGGASANFVKKGADGLLYVAYGLDGVQVLELSKQ